MFLLLLPLFLLPLPYNNHFQIFFSYYSAFTNQAPPISTYFILSSLLTTKLKFPLLHLYNPKPESIPITSPHITSSLLFQLQHNSFSAKPPHSSSFIHDIYIYIYPNSSKTLYNAYNSITLPMVILRRTKNPIMYINPLTLFILEKKKMKPETQPLPEITLGIESVDPSSSPKQLNPRETPFST